MALTTAQVSVRVVPDVRGFQRQVRRDLTAAKLQPVRVPMRVATDRMVVGMRRAFDSVQSHAARASVRVAQAFAAQMPRASAAVAQFAAGFQRVESTANGVAARMHQFGATTRRALDSTSAPLRNFHAGFRSADGAASALTGRMGSLGGLSRRAFEAAAQPLRNFHAGFTQLGAASSAFSGRMGTLGGVSRRAIGGLGSTFARVGTSIRATAQSIGASIQNGIDTPLRGVARRAGGLAAAVGLGSLGSSALQAAQDI
ncbi:MULTISPECIES: hypothetical protein [unclassified Pseudonocardia]|uniref:hypothetical protein n=1 Tax=unclassified Pseudonocardia TaxID=2619320 RepID=UPI001CF685D6|nr:MULTISPECIES: hypothetical protein [unclassified Pseudonocardia]